MPSKQQHRNNKVANKSDPEGGIQTRSCFEVMGAVTGGYTWGCNFRCWMEFAPRSMPPRVTTPLEGGNGGIEMGVQF